MRLGARLYGVGAERFRSACTRMIGGAARIPGLRHVVVLVLDWRSKRGPLGRRHPFDRRYGVATSGTVPGFALMASANAYAAAQPSIIHRAIAALPDASICHFVDLGCGKGRPLLVAALAGSRAVTGVERSPTLARIARRNVARFGRHSAATPIDVLCCDALEISVPDGALAVFLYNPFSDAVMAGVLARLEASLLRAPRDLYVIAYNPVAARLFDDSPALERFYAAQIPYHAEEIGFGPDEDDAVVIWCDRGNPAARRWTNRNDPVTVLSSMRAVVDAQP